MQDKVSLERSALIEALRHIEEIVLSLDRIGSTASDLSESEFHKAVAEFVIDWKVEPRLSDVRRILSEAFTYDELERLFGEVETWTITRRKP